MSDKKEIKTVPLNPALLGKKIGMTRVYDEKGAIVPVTVVQAGPCSVTQVKTADGKDGYNSIQFGFDEVKAKFSTIPLIGHAAKAGFGPLRHFAEAKQDGKPEVAVGDKLTVGIFEGVAYVDVIGVSKGKGFAGVMKRHHFGGQCASHGTERKHRSPGSIDMAKQNADRAGVAQLTSFAAADISSFAPETAPAMIIFNPPYGERMGDFEELSLFTGRLAIL